MKVVNATAYPTRVLKALLVEVYRRSRKYGTRVAQWAQVVVRVTPSRTKYDCQPTWTARPADRFEVNLVIPAKEADPLLIVREFEAGLVWLESGKAGTYPHPGDSVLQDKSPWADAIVGGGFVPHRPPPPPKDEAALRYARTLALLKKWQRKLKLAETKILKLERRRKQYEKRRNP